MLHSDSLFDTFLVYSRGVSKCLPAYCKDDTPNACYDDIPAEDKEAAAGYAKLMGVVALDILISKFVVQRIVVL